MNLPAMTETGKARVRDLQDLMMTLEQPELPTAHVLHAGVYARTIKIPWGHVLVGAHVIIPTTLTVCGDVTVSLGDESFRLQGYYVLAAPAGRKQAFLAHEDTMLTMAFATDAKTVQEAEAQFTDEAGLLLSRRSVNYVDMGGRA